jgi:very-short-patch-repair endonuclease
MVVFRERPTLRAQELRNDATEAEKHLWRRLSRRQLGGWKFSRQIPVGAFICDFVCREARLIVESDGGQHDERAAQDEARTRFLVGEGFQVIRFWNNEVFENPDGVLIRILEVLESRPTPDPSRKREGS